MLIRSSPLPETAQSPTNLDENSRVGQIQPTSAKARYIGPVHPETYEGLKSPQLSTKHSHSRQQQQQQLQQNQQQRQFGYIETQFAPVEADENFYYSAAAREVAYSDITRMSELDAPAAPPPPPPPPPLAEQSTSVSLQPPPPPPQSPTEGEPASGTVGNKAVSHNGVKAPNIRGSPAARNIVVGEILNSEHLTPGKLPMKGQRSQVELENEALKKISQKAQNLPPPVESSQLLNSYRPYYQQKPQQQYQEQQQHQIEFDKDAPEPPRRRVVRAPVQCDEQQGAGIGEWIFETDVTWDQTQAVAEVGAQPQFPGLRQQQQQQQQNKMQYYMQDDGGTKQYYYNNIQQQQQRQLQTGMPYYAQDDDAFKQLYSIYEQQRQIYKQQTEQQRERPAVQYVQQPWDLTIRKQLFHPNEQLGDEQEINLIFAQIIADCRKPKAYRIRNFERDAISQILRAHHIPPAALNNPQQIAVDVKVAVIQCARRWPLYFSVLFPVTEQLINRDEVINARRILALHETGLTLLSQESGDGTVESPLKTLLHFDYGDITDMQMDGTGEQLRFQTRQFPQLVLRTEHVPQIRSVIEKVMSANGGKVRTYMRAVADYITNEPNLLSFSKGDVIQIISRGDGGLSIGQNNEQWLYGRIGNHFGNLPANYVEPLDMYGQMSDLPPAINSTIATDGYFDELDYDKQFPVDPADSDIGGANRYTMMQFAMLYFRRPKGVPAGINTLSTGSATRRKKDWTWKEIAEKVKYTNKPITHSLLRLDNNEADKLSQDAFMCIMRYMGDENLKRGQTLTDCVYELLMICHQYQPLRDEVYCQIIRQTTNNKSPREDSSIRGWRLFSILTAYFDCSQVLKPYLFKYLIDMANDQRRAYHGTASICLQNLAKTLKYGGRQFLLSGGEVEAITMGKTLKRQLYHLPGGHKQVINTHSVTVVEEIIQQLCEDLNIRSPAEQQEFCLCYILKSEGKMKMLANDEYILDVCTELEHDQKQYFLLLKRSVWIHPLRLDNARYIDVMFFQTVPDYIEGLLIAPKNGKVSADILDDIARLGACLHLADKKRPTHITAKNVSELIPKTVYPIRTADQWVERVNTKLHIMHERNLDYTDARAQFLEILEKWPYFGTTFFFVRNVVDGDQKTGECILAVNKRGIEVISIKDREKLLEIALTQIMSTNRYSTQHGIFLDIKVGNQHKHKNITIHTEQGAEISRLLGQYIYVDSENRSFITGIEQQELHI